MTDRELDALVAEKIMGAVWKNITPAGRKKQLSFPNQRPMLIRNHGEKDIFTGYNEDNLPRYSTDISSAWKVIEEIQKSDHFTAFCREMSNHHLLGLPSRDASIIICLSALKAKGADIK